MKTSTRRLARIRAFEIAFATLNDNSDSWKDASKALESMTPEFRFDDLPLFTTELLDIVAEKKQSIFDEITACLENWEFHRIGKAELTIMLLGATELLHVASVPQRVTINEYVELSKIYCDTDSRKFVNGILDKLSRRYPR